jgi:hypothetical protein
MVLSLRKGNDKGTSTIKGNDSSTWRESKAEIGFRPYKARGKRERNRTLDDFSVLVKQIKPILNLRPRFGKIWVDF